MESLLENQDVTISLEEPKQSLQGEGEMGYREGRRVKLELSEFHRSQECCEVQAMLWVSKLTWADTWQIASNMSISHSPWPCLLPCPSIKENKYSVLSHRTFHKLISY